MFFQLLYFLALVQVQKLMTIYLFPLGKLTAKLTVSKTLKNQNHIDLIYNRCEEQRDETVNDYFKNHFSGFCNKSNNLSGADLYILNFLLRIVFIPRNMCGIDG